MRRGVLALVVSLAAAPLLGQAPPETATPFDRLGAIVKDGHLNVEADLRQGSVPAIPKYTLEVQGSPKTTIEADAVDGAVTKMRFLVAGGNLVVRGKGLRPKVAIESLDFEAPKGLIGLKFHGLGIWRPIVAVFGGIARSAVRKMEFRTDIPSVLKGEILGGKKPAAAPPGPPPEATPAPAGPPPTPTPSFMDLVDEVRIRDAKMTAFAGRAVAFEPFVSFHTASQPAAGEAMTLTIEKGVFRPGRDGAPNFVELSGHIDGEIENGEMEFEKNKCAIAKGRLRGGAFEATTGEDGKLASAFSADELFFEMTSGKFVVPGGMGVEIDQGSTFDVSKVRVTAAGKFSGVAKLDLVGKTGELSRKGATISASGVRLKTPGLTVVDGRATGPLELSFDYQLEYPFVVKYPIQEIPEKTLMLDFHGPFATTLALSDAGGEEGEVTGAYVFKAPWAPIEAAALVALAAKWQQDLAVKHVDFAIVPKTFRPCGESCFTLSIEVTAEKKRKGMKALFSQFCAPIGKANLVVEKADRSFALKDVRIETHCKGVVGFVINFLAPFLTKSYSDMKLFQMPANLPMTIDKVRGGAEWVEISGTIDWQAGEPKPEVPPAPQPVVVEPSR
ncbi:MAG: hypothetical protein WAU32_02800 [Thermoanaerobaculia bacterium]